MPQAQAQQRGPQRKQPDTTIGPIFQVRDLTGGVNLRVSATNIQPEQARRLLNTLISAQGELAVYPGWETWSASSLGSRRLQGGRRVYLSGATFTLAGDNGSVYKPNDATKAWGSAVLSSLNASNIMDFPFDRDIVAVFDGANIPQKTSDGTTWSQLGIDAPTTDPTAAAAAGGSLADGDTYEFSYAYGNSTLGHYGNESATVQQAVSGGNLTVDVSYTASADAQVDKIRIYARDVTAGELVRRLVATVSNATSTYSVTSNSWSSGEEAPTTHDVAVAMAFGTVWKNRWWGVDATIGNRLRFSEIFQNQSWPDTYYVDIPLVRGEDIQAIIPLGDVLVVFGYTEFYLIIGQTSLDFEVRPSLGGQTGALGHRAVDVLENGVVHAGENGVFLFNGAGDDLLSYDIQPGWLDYVANSTASELSQTPLVYDRHNKELRIGVARLYPTGDRGEWILDLNRTRSSQDQHPAWFSTDRTIGGYIFWDGNEAATGADGTLYSWSPTIAKLYHERTGTSADGSDISMEYDGYMLPFGIQKTRIVDTYIEYQPASGNITVDLKVDGQLMGAQTISAGSALAQYGTAVYGTDQYGGADRKTLPVVWPLNAEGYAAQLLIKYVGQGTFKCFTYGHNSWQEILPRGL